MLLQFNDLILLGQILSQQVMVDIMSV